MKRFRSLRHDTLASDEGGQGVSSVTEERIVGGEALAGSQTQLRHEGFAEPYTWAFHDSDEIGPVMLARIARRTGLKVEDL